MNIEKIHDNKNHEQIKEKLNEEINKISEKIHEKTNIQSLLLQYNRYNNNSHIPVGIISLFAISFVAERMINIDIANTIMIGLVGSSALSLGTKIYFKKKQDDMKKENPNIDFQNYNIDDNYEVIENLFNKKFELVNELEKVNKNTNNKEQLKQSQIINEININNNIEPEKEKQKVKTLKRM